MGEQERGGLTPEGQAARMARQIGDEEWRKGNTKYALEAYEVSNITSDELLGMAEKLLKAADIALSRKSDLREALCECSHRIIPIANLRRGCERNCPACKITEVIDKRFFPMMAEALGWNEQIVRQDVRPEFYRSAAVACLKLIKRMA